MPSPKPLSGIFRQKMESLPIDKSRIPMANIGLIEKKVFQRTTHLQSFKEGLAQNVGDL